jgi:hypothetical protein
VDSVRGDQVEEELVNAEVVTKFRMEGGGEEMALTDQDGEVVAGGEGLDLGPGAGDARGADEDHLEGGAGEFGGGGEDGGVDLAAVGVAFNGDVEGGEGDLRGILYVVREQDCARAGAEGGEGADQGSEGFEEAVALQEFEHGGGLAAGDDEAVYAGGSFGGEELVRCADEAGGHIEGSEGFGVGFVGSLEGQDANGRKAGCCAIIGHVSPLTWL